MSIVLVSGGFDPIHSGHIELLSQAKLLGDKLIVLLNSDEWLTRKKGKPFLCFDERVRILKSLKYVDEIWAVDDSDDTVCKGLEAAKVLYKGKEIVFANGGDRIKSNTAEEKISNIKFEYAVGGINKVNSSSKILKNWETNGYEDRIWGSFYELLKDDNVKVKELIIDPFKFTSYQKHLKRNELWFISKGSCSVKIARNTNKPKLFKVLILHKHDYFIVKTEEWHQIINDNKEPCHIIEIQYGEQTEETDIIREFSKPKIEIQESYPPKNII